VIRMISWVPLLGDGQRRGQPGIAGCRADRYAIEWLLFSNFSVVLAFVHLYTMFHDRADLQLDDAHRPCADRSRARLRRQRLATVECGGAAQPHRDHNRFIFVITIVMGDFVTSA